MKRELSFPYFFNVYPVLGMRIIRHLGQSQALHMSVYVVRVRWHLIRLSGAPGMSTFSGYSGTDRWKTKGKQFPFRLVPFVKDHHLCRATSYSTAVG